MIFPKPPSAYTIRDNAVWPFPSRDFRMTDKETGQAFTNVSKAEVHTFAGEQWQWDSAAPAPGKVDVSDALAKLDAARAAIAELGGV